MSDTVKPVEVLAVAPHPDDAEIFCGGTLAKLSSLGHSVGILDLTEGELSTQGDVVARRTEAAEASKVLGLRWRGNLSLPDGMISAEDSRQIATLVERLRELRPELLLIPPWQGATSRPHFSGSALPQSRFSCGTCEVRASERRCSQGAAAGLLPNAARIHTEFYLRYQRASGKKNGSYKGLRESGKPGSSCSFERRRRYVSAERHRPADKLPSFGPVN